MKNPVNMRPPKETSKALVIDSKETEIYELSDKEFRIILLNLVNYNIQLNEIRKTLHEQNKKFDKVIDAIKK